jgi:hypothetical protein
VGVSVPPLALGDQALGIGLGDPLAGFDLLGRVVATPAGIVARRILRRPPALRDVVRCRR